MWFFTVKKKTFKGLGFKFCFWFLGFYKLVKTNKLVKTFKRWFFQTWKGKGCLWYFLYWVLLF
jgi:hypothetical protein